MPLHTLKLIRVCVFALQAIAGDHSCGQGTSHFYDVLVRSGPKGLSKGIESERDVICVQTHTHHHLSVYLLSLKLRLLSCELNTTKHAWKLLVVSGREGCLCVSSRLPKWCTAGTPKCVFGLVVCRSTSRKKNVTLCLRRPHLQLKVAFGVRANGI